MPPGPRTPRRDENSSRDWWATGLETPVFFDERGHRAKLVRLGVACSLLLVAAWLALVVSGPLGFSTLPTERFLLPHARHHHTTASIHGRAGREAPES